MNKKFNLVTDPWIKVIELDSYQEKLVSLSELFDNAPRYLQLAGETKSQDLAILRLLLAILTTAYSRKDYNGDSYNGKSGNSLKKTWSTIYSKGEFSKTILDYLQNHIKDFNFFGKRPFYQVTAKTYDELVPDSKKIAHGKGVVGVRQINRTINESGNQPSIFSPKSGCYKDHLEIDELIRWIISYQDYTGVTDKTKIKNTDFKTSPGWLYRLNPVFIKGETLFNTLIYNLILTSDGNQKPIWEWKNIKDYIIHQNKLAVPDNLSELYTMWSRILHIEWNDKEEPIIFTAGIPVPSTKKAFIEPMTSWSYSTKNKVLVPNRRSLMGYKRPMWFELRKYIGVDDEKNREPGIIKWLKNLYADGTFKKETSFRLVSTTFISESNLSSQGPAAEYDDDLPILSSVLLDAKWQQTLLTGINYVRRTSAELLSLVGQMANIKKQNIRKITDKVRPDLYKFLENDVRTWLSEIELENDPDEKLQELITSIRFDIEEFSEDVTRPYLVGGDPKVYRKIESFRKNIKGVEPKL